MAILVSVAVTFTTMGSNKKFSFRALAAVSALALTLTVPSPADAAWKWGRTWSQPTASRYLSYAIGNLTASQIAAVTAANIQYDNTSSSTLNISGVSPVSAAYFSARKFSVLLVSPNDWPFDPSIPGITCRTLTCPFDPQHYNLSDEGYVLLNGHFSFTSAFLIQYFAVDTQTVVLHELGHAHGLGHPWQDPNQLNQQMTTAEVESVMNATNTEKRHLMPDDLVALAAIY